MSVPTGYCRNMRAPSQSEIFEEEPLMEESQKHVFVQYRLVVVAQETTSYKNNLDSTYPDDWNCIFK